jgi:hypothetical protein
VEDLTFIVCKIMSLANSLWLSMSRIRSLTSSAPTSNSKWSWQYSPTKTLTTSTTPLRGSTSQMKVLSANLTLVSTHSAPTI